MIDARAAALSLESWIPLDFARPQLPDSVPVMACGHASAPRVLAYTCERCASTVRSVRNKGSGDFAVGAPLSNKVQRRDAPPP